MEKFNFGSYDSTRNDSPFVTQQASYTQVSSESMARKELGQPAAELREFINSSLPVKEVSGSDKIIQLRVDDSGLIKYSLDGETWVDTASGGHNIYADNTQLAQKTKLMFRNTNCYNSGDYTVVEGIQGQQGVSVSSMVQVEESSTSGGNNKWRATLSNGTTYDFIVKNGSQGEKGDTGEQGNGLNILGTYATLEALQEAHPTGNEGDIYSVGNGVTNTCYCWDTDDNGWESIGRVQGEKGAKGDTGNTGATGNGIQSIVVEESSVSGGNNVVTITMTGGQTYTFNVKNGTQGAAGEGMKTGGTTGQVLAKASNLDYDCNWVNLPTVDQSYNSSSSNAQSGTAVASAISNKVTSRYAEINVPTSNWTSCTVGGESAYYISIALSGATSGRHGIFSVKITKPSTMDAENEMFGQIISITENTNTITIFANAIPTTAYKLQAVDY